jgi:Asp-tRNA(Asn)/Glu-tRNA(Gln) amidotransferase A subunit family amidase
MIAPACACIGRTSNGASAITTSLPKRGDRRPRVVPKFFPVGAQIVGRDKQDFSVLQLADAFEPTTDFG